jgi:DNA adenine methylase
MPSSTSKIKPFVKWCGGKGRVAAHILRRLPDSIETYYEPMVGGGAIFFELARSKRFRNAVLADCNPELMNAWDVVKNDVESLIRELRKKRYRYDRDMYLRIRSERPVEKVKIAARFIYLNRCGFNGLYRVNSQGEFNVPFGRYADPVICDSSNLREVSKLLEGVTLQLSDFEQTVQPAGHGDAVYFDPPYLPVSDTSKFTSFTANGFRDEDHERLAKVFFRLGSKAVRVVLSNSVAPKALQLYGACDMDVIVGSRSIGGPANYRKPAGEIVVFHGPKL